MRKQTVFLHDNARALSSSEHVDLVACVHVCALGTCRSRADVCVSVYVYCIYACVCVHM